MFCVCLMKKGEMFLGYCVWFLLKVWLFSGMMCLVWVSRFLEVLKLCMMKFRRLGLVVGL